MQKRLMTALFTAATLFTVAGCSSNQAVETTDGKTIVTDGKPEQINRDQLKNMSELDN
ncbi:YgdI/YgdR family lipoprotein [Salmonella enterica]|nr:YgdI/YgdR family lipoprotein [Salmonella enterica]ECM3644125.1 YgdI/YgdR family lipoprotein [Salmonella enterica subsp. enterica serovar Typhimurium]EDP9264261.1 YgdI/YgdR family lipoprotein [Salmonella enterica subsp. houtenae]EDQ3905452.1 YgdI/YgdR family lipoprotein [Salmonella enterica subsp. houtenae]EDR7560005.1 YgdI/YgdR family lipoprotein [Salmonella enterica subsp. houtenae]